MSVCQYPECYALWDTHYGAIAVLGHCGLVQLKKAEMIIYRYYKKCKLQTRARRHAADQVVRLNEHLSSLQSLKVQIPSSDVFSSAS